MIPFLGRNLAAPSPIGKPCELTIGLKYANGREAASAWRYGSESQGPHPEVVEFVKEALRITEPWFQRQKAIADNWPRPDEAPARGRFGFTASRPNSRQKWRTVHRESDRVGPTSRRTPACMDASQDQKCSFRLTAPHESNRLEPARRPWPGPLLSMAAARRHGDFHVEVAAVVGEVVVVDAEIQLTVALARNIESAPTKSRGAPPIRAMQSTRRTIGHLAGGRGAPAGSRTAGAARIRRVRAQLHRARRIDAVQITVAHVDTLVLVQRSAALTITSPGSSRTSAPERTPSPFLSWFRNA